MLTKSEGELAVKLARSSITEYILNRKKISPKNLPKVFDENRGVFVTLNKDDLLRGCIGRPYPVMPLKDGIIISAINAALEDPRFSPLRKDEIDKITVEVTILTVPEIIEADPEDLPNKIVIGRDGLIVKKGVYQGLLLPQVAVEHGFDSTEFLCQTCIKAGLSPYDWLKGVEVYTFKGQIFYEVEPNGEIKEKKYY